MEQESRNRIINKFIGGISMRNLLNKKLKNEKGMTLIELLAVIVIIAIIALIAVPAIGNIIANSKSKAVLSDASTIVSGAKTAIADGACTEEADKTITCNDKQLTPFVELEKGAALVDGDKVIKKGSEYTITYKGFGKLKDGKVKDAFTEASKDNTITSAKLAEVMGNK